MTAPISTSQLTAALEWRYATKKFDAARAIPADTWAAIEHSLVLTPSSFGLQPWRFLVITDPALRAKMVPISWGQKQLVEASHVIAFAAAENLSAADIDRFIGSMAATRGTPAETLKGYRDMMAGSMLSRSSADIHVWAARQTYIALGQAMAAAALLGVDACPMEGFEPEAMNTLLGLDGSGYRVVVLLPCGYRAADDKYASLPKVRFPASEVIVRR